jgi:hypothetical protein
LGFFLTADDIGSIEAVDNPERHKPFLVIAWAEQPLTASWSIRRRRDLLVWAHDDSADYGRIDRILSRVHDLLVGTIHQGGISQVRYTGASGDLYDDGFHTITRNYGFRVIGTD